MAEQQHQSQQPQPVFGFATPQGFVQVPAAGMYATPQGYGAQMIQPWGQPVMLTPQGVPQQQPFPYFAAPAPMNSDQAQPMPAGQRGGHRNPAHDASRSRGRGGSGANRGNSHHRQADRAPPSAQELHQARMLRGAPVICNSGSRQSSSHSGSGNGVNASGAALLNAGARLAEATPPQTTGEPHTNPGAGTSTTLHVDASASTVTPHEHSVAPPAPESLRSSMKPEGGDGAGPLSDSDRATHNSSGVASQRSFRVVRKSVKSPESDQPGSAPGGLPSTANLPTTDGLAAWLRRAIVVSAADMFLPDADLHRVRKQVDDAAIAEAFGRASVGEAMDAVVQVLGNHESRPNGFEALEGHGSLPLVAGARLVGILEKLSATLEHFKKHATRTLLNLVADATTDRDQRLCAAVLLGLLFRLGFYGENDPYQVLVDVLAPFGAVTGPETARAITRLLQVSNATTTTATGTLYRLVCAGQPASQPLPNPAAFLEARIADGAPAPSPPPQTEPGASSSSNVRRPPPPPYISQSDMSEAPMSLDGSAEGLRRRTVYVTRVDPSMSEGELRSILLECGEFDKVRLCGDTPGRCKYCFVEFSADAAAKRMVKMDGRWFGTQQLRVGLAKAPIETNDPRDALFDASRGKVRACVFGLSLKPTESATSVKQLAHSAPLTVTNNDRAFRAERSKRTDALVEDPQRPATGVMNRASDVQSLGSSIKMENVPADIAEGSA